MELAGVDPIAAILPGEPVVPNWLPLLLFLGNFIEN
jgi:hypothetical protein